MAKILIVSDDPQIVKLIALNLDKRNHQEMSCNTSLASISSKADLNYDLVLLDADLSEEQHARTAKKLEVMTAAKHIPMVLISPVKLTKKELVGLGIVDQATKPFAVEELLQKINHALVGPIGLGTT